ncbi:MAG TPA: GMC family oxidoreductase [Amaricoccus sp.]|nr:GMC family oxidoreductase [Amaricoccus sp.]
MTYKIFDDADVIVVGAGLGGSVAAVHLARGGLNVLVLEAGPEPAAAAAARPRSTLRRLMVRIGDKLGLIAPDPAYVSYATRQGGGAARPVLVRHGRGPGGSSALYAAALSRFRRVDFTTSKPGTAANPALPNAWPVSYDEFTNYYRRAEAMMGVRGHPDPTDSDDAAQLLPPPPLGPEAIAVHDALTVNGLHPFRLHVGIAYREGCAECFGYRCGAACKSDGYNRVLQEAVESGLLRLRTGTTVARIDVDERGVKLTLAGSGDVLRAPRLVLAAGTLNTPLILERSEALWRETERPPMLGRGLMFHLSEAFTVRTGADGSAVPRKWLGLRDFYDDGEANLGEIQSIGAYVRTGAIMHGLRMRAVRRLPRPLIPLVELLRPAAWGYARAVGPLAIYATITEDLPHPGNMVREENGHIVACYTPDPDLVAHTKAMRGRIREAFAPLPVRFLSEPGTPNWGHPMGTCRMGLDPATSVVDPEGRLHGHPAIRIADASTLPSSGGTGPSLTVMANALRVAAALATEFVSADERHLAAG